MTPLSVELFTDPACPFAFSAEPIRMRLRWHYGAGLRWSVRMIVLTREPGEAQKLAAGAPGLQKRFGMPIDPVPYARPASSEPACRAVVGARLHAPERAEALLRALRVRVMQAGLLDDPQLIAAAASDAAVSAAELDRWMSDPDVLAALEADAAAASDAAVSAAELDRWMSDPDVLAALEADAAAARTPLPAARALNHKLGGPAHERRYTAPSYIIDGVAVPGFNPVEVYETVIANRAPHLERRPVPRSVAEVLDWATEPLATAEIALLTQVDIPTARERLAQAGTFLPAGADGYWVAAGAAGLTSERARPPA